MPRSLGVIAVGLFASPVFAAIVSIDARVSTAVQELVDGQPASVNSDEDRGDPSASAPLAGLADVLSTDLEGVLVARGLAIGTVDDPTRLAEPNPQELAVEVASFSNSATVTHLVTASAVETRSSVLSRGEITFNADGTRTIESAMFFSGAIVAWAADREGELANLTGGVSVEVVRGDDAIPLFRAGLNLAGAFGEGAVFDSEGPLRFERIGVDELAARGVGGASLSGLRRLEEEGLLVILAIPAQGHVYSYEVRSGAGLNLTARVEARARTAAGTGLAITVGRPFAELAAFIDSALPDIVGATVQKAINQSVAARDIPQSAPPEGRFSPAACSTLGMEATLFAFLFLSLLFRSRE